MPFELQIAQLSLEFGRGGKARTMIGKALQITYGHTISNASSP